MQTRVSHVVLAHVNLINAFFMFMFMFMYVDLCTMMSVPLSTDNGNKIRKHRVGWRRESLLPEAAGTKTRCP